MKTVAEWSVAFDILYNNIMSNQAPGLEEYEKSIFLTRAQEGLVKDYFSMKSNQLAEGFDGSARRQADFSTLIKTSELTADTGAATSQLDQRSSTKRYVFPTNPEKIIAVLNENFFETTGAGTSAKMKSFVVVPISQDEYMRLMSKPYKYPPKGQAWRLITYSSDSSQSGGVITTSPIPKIELIGRFQSTGATFKYEMRYVVRPKPIVLATPPTGLNVDGVNTVQTCELPEHLHDEILQRAVMLAKIAWGDPVPSATQTR